MLFTYVNHHILKGFLIFDQLENFYYFHIIILYQDHYLCSFFKNAIRLHYQQFLRVIIKDIFLMDITIQFFFFRIFFIKKKK